jgi:hypothetical protein
MTTMRFEMHNDKTGPIVLRLSADDTREQITTTITDTAAGVELRTEIVTAAGEHSVVSDQIDRATPPLRLMLAALQELFLPFATNTQAALNDARYRRLKAEGKPLTVQAMCMDGHHTGPEFADIPFKGGIVGVPEADEDTALRDPEVSDDFLARLWGDDEEDAA